MCTISFLPMRSGFLLAMNRDEQKTRPRALKPRKYWTGTHAALFPSEPDGGTWVGVSDAGLSLALINWYAKPQRDRALCVSRGVIIPHLLAAESMADIGAMFADLPLERINPFRLIAASAHEKRLREWRWDGTVLSSHKFRWSRRHWFSSGYNEALVNKKRAAAVRGMAALTPARLRKLHAAHLPERGPFSLCMHREEAETVSYTEITVSRSGAEMRYAAGSPCRKESGTPRALSFAREA
ncbi:MAG TPA: NRDE family protein [Rhizomicrobium sp.]|jgi:hypothetical protein